MAEAGSIWAKLGLKGGSEFQRDVEKATKGATKSMDGMNRSAASFMTSMGSIKGLLASLGVGLFLKSSVEEFMHAEQSSRNLQVAIEQQGGSWQKLRGQFEEFAKARQKKTMFGDEESLDAATRYINATGDVANALDRVRLGQDIAAGSGRGLEEIMLALGQAQNGNVRQLGMLVPALRMLEGEEKTWIEIQSILLKQFDGMAEATGQTSAGRVKVLANAFSDLQENIGALIVKLGTPVAELAIKNLNALLEFNEGRGIGESAKNFDRKTAQDQLNKVNTTIEAITRQFSEADARSAGWMTLKTALENRLKELDAVEAMTSEWTAELKNVNAELAKMNRSGIGGAIRSEFLAKRRAELMSGLGLSEEKPGMPGGVREFSGEVGRVGSPNVGKSAQYRETVEDVLAETGKFKDSIKSYFAEIDAAVLVTGNNVNSFLSPAFADFFEQLTINANDPHIFKNFADSFIAQIRRMIAEALAFAAVMGTINYLMGGTGSFSGFFFDKLGIKLPGTQSMPGGGLSGTTIEVPVVLDGVEIARASRKYWDQPGKRVGGTAD